MSWSGKLSGTVIVEPTDTLSLATGKLIVPEAYETGTTLLFVGSTPCNTARPAFSLVSIALPSVSRI